MRVGDIITDLGAMLQGQVSLFEPIHGSAPKHAGKNIASPVAAIMAGAMMLDFLGEKKASVAIESSVADLLRSGKLKGVGTADHVCSEGGDMVVEEVRAAVAKA